MAFIDLNCDMGEGFGNYAMPNDETLFQYISSANIACGFHAGDPATMELTVKAAIQHGVAIGAHPGLPDLQGFGRREMNITPKEAYQITLYQTGALSAFVKAAGGTLHHVKPHGALYNMAAKDTALAQAIVEAVHDFNTKLILYALSGSKMIAAAERAGMATASEVFADRSYQDDGSLTPRSQKEAMITDAERSLEQVLTMVNHQHVISVSKKTVALKAETLCLHGDGPHAIEFARSIHEQLKKEGIIIKAPVRL